MARKPKPDHIDAERAVFPYRRRAGLDAKRYLGEALRSRRRTAEAGIRMTGNDDLNWPHCDVLNWPHLRPIVA
jgi:hypothetical protein